MEDLIKALQIFLKYDDVKYPIHCEHDVMYVCGYYYDAISKEDINALEELGFDWDDDMEHFYSFKYGSC